MTKLAFVFPGQGSQSIGMLASLSEQYPKVIETFAEASELLGYDTWQLAQEGPADKLNLTVYTQPMLLIASTAIWRVWLESGGARPDLMAGHSLGEYSALACAGAIEFLDAVKLVQRRAELMQAAVPEGEGAMAAIIGMTPEQVESFCQKAAEGDVLMPANFNAHGQIVIAGTGAAVARALSLAKGEGAKLAKKLPMSIPSHCSLLREAADELAQDLAEVEILSPKTPIINNADVRIESKPEDIKKALIKQLHSPVRWIETIEAFVAKDVQTAIELGPGQVLSKLIKRTAGELETFTTESTSSFAQALESHQKL